MSEAPSVCHIHSPHYYLFEHGSGSHTFSTKESLLKYASTLAGPCWIDVRDECSEGRQAVLREISLGADVPPSVLQEVVMPSEHDVVQLQPVSASYISGVVSCAGGSALFLGEYDFEGQSTGAAVPYTAETVDAGNGMVWCSFLCTERALLTFHTGGFVGLEEMVREMELRFPPPTARTDPFVTAAALATLVAFTSETMLPDPTALLGEVDCIDEMVLLIAPGERDQPDLLRRVALLRRRISSFRGRLYLKEKLLQEMVTPAMRGSFASRDPTHTVSMYKEAQETIAQVADRLDDARDVLNQANLNFVTGVSMRMSQSSANMDWKMQILGQVATICLPLNLLASIFGMNVTVPWQSDTHPSLNAFFGIVGAMVLWVLVCSIPTIRGLMKGNGAKAIVPSD